MDPQLENWLTLIGQDAANVLDALDSFNDRIQEGYDRGFDQAVVTLGFPLDGDLSHLSLAKLQGLLVARNTLQATLEANNRNVIKGLLGVVRAWTR